MPEDIKYIPYELALKIVGNVIEEEHLYEENRRVLTVYDKRGRELCWFDAEEILAEAGVTGQSDEAKAAAVERVMHQIPEWALEGSAEGQEGC